jgi:predicted DNA-binding transcriptional regulator YafY
MTREQIEAAVLTSPHPHGRRSQLRRVYGIEDYLNVNGPYLSARQAAHRLGRSPRTITRYRAALRQAAS